MEQRFNIYFSGELLPGHAPLAVREGLARLFNADEATLDKLFSGKPMLLKKRCDEATALKYRQAMERAGALATIRAAAAEPAPAPVPAQPGRAMTTAQRVAALAAAGNTPEAKPVTPGTAASGDAGDDTLSLAAAGSPVMRDEERSIPEIRQIDTSALVVDARAERLSPMPAPTPPPPDTSHLSLGATGEAIPTLAQDHPPPPPDTSAIALSSEGSDFSDCAAPAAMEPALDLSALVLSPAGADVLDEQYRRQAAATAPDTSHISLQD